jgi:hypothetical protein
MENNYKFKGLLPYLGAVLFFLIITFIYFSPVLSGKVTSMHDSNMSTATAQELIEFHKNTGEWAWWTNSSFGGMPGFMITGGYPYNISAFLGGKLTSLFPNPVNVIFLLMLGFFILTISLKSNYWVSILVSIAYGFGTYNLLYTEAGHISKIIALAFAPPILAGFIYIFNKKYFLGIFLTSLFLALELYANHLQITYYFFFILLAYSLFEGIKLIIKKETKQISLVLSSLLLSVMIGVGTNAERLWNNYNYSKETMRGKSELKASISGSQGLDKEYAFGWSYGIDETVNLLVPNLMGGGSSGSLPETSETFKTLVNGGVDQNMASQFITQLPLYFGKQSITSGPSYSGIIIIFFFILGIFISKNRFYSVISILTVFFIFLAWGSNFSSFNDLIFDYLPGYNKFRAVTMTLVIVHFLLVLGATLSLNELVNLKVSWEELKKKCLYTAGIIIFIMFGGYFMVDFTGPNDSNFKSSLSSSLGPDFANKVLISMQSDRADLAFSDIIRGIILLIITGVVIALFFKNKFNSKVFAILLLVLVSFDMLSVGKRYYNNDDFVSKSTVNENFEPTPADLEILKDTDPNYRVINLTTSFWSDARESYFHKSIGGYHGAKLKKIQELYEYQMTKDGKLNMNILNMMNVRYFITAAANNQAVAQRNPDAIGNAWYVDTLKVVNTADEELSFLEKFDPRSIAITQKNQGIRAFITNRNPTDSISLTKYTPNELTYSSSSTSSKFAVFSEVYYRGNIDWKSYIDGKEVPHQKVNYVLRGLEIPSGKHEITFKFKPESVEKGKYIDLAASISLLLVGFVSIIAAVKKKD